jgi:hypothetical protein
VQILGQCPAKMAVRSPQFAQYGVRRQCVAGGNLPIRQSFDMQQQQLALLVPKREHGGLDRVEARCRRSGDCIRASIDPGPPCAPLPFGLDFSRDAQDMAVRVVHQARFVPGAQSAGHFLCKNVYVYPGEPQHNCHRTENRIR